MTVVQAKSSGTTPITGAFRAGTVHLLRDHENRRPAIEILTAVAEALEADSRVTELVLPSINEKFSGGKTIYPTYEGMSTVDLLFRAHAHSVQFSDPLFMRVSVPRKNQRRIHGEEEAPSEDYIALWDGETLLVAWETDEYASPLTPGGHIVAEILETATDSIDLGTYVQACSPYCDNVFIHNTIRSVASATNDDYTATMVSAYTLEIEAPAGESLEDTTYEVWYRFMPAVGDFAPVKGLSRRILDLERATRGELDTLTRRLHERSRASLAPFKARVPEMWRHRHWRRDCRATLATLWVLLGEIESARRSWIDAHWRFEQSTIEAGTRKYFDRDERDDEVAIKTLDTAPIQSAMEHAAARIDTSAIIVATFVGAIAGAIAGALVAFL